MTPLSVNNKIHHIQSDPEKPLLWVLRDELGLKGTKYGCGVGVCGACLVQLAPAAVAACLSLNPALNGHSMRWRGQAQRVLEHQDVVLVLGIHGLDAVERSHILFDVDLFRVLDVVFEPLNGYRAVL